MRSLMMLIAAGAIGLATISAAGATTVYVLGDGGANAATVADLRTGADGRLYFTTVPANAPATSGEIGVFDPTRRRQSFATVAYMPSLIAQTTTGVWVEEHNNTSGKPTIDRYPNIGGAPHKVLLPIGPFNNGYLNGIAGGIAEGVDGGLWWASNNSPQVGEIDGPSNAVTVYGLPAPAGGYAPQPADMTLGPDGFLWSADIANDGLFRIEDRGNAKGSSTYAQLAQGNINTTVLSGVVGGSDGRVYAISYGLYTAVAYLNRSRTAPSPIFGVDQVRPPNVAPERMASGRGTIYFADNGYGSLGIFDIARGTFQVLPLPAPATGTVAVDRDGTPWVACAIPIPKSYATKACIEPVRRGPAWTIFPSASHLDIAISNGYNVFPPALVGIGETGDSGPFSVRSSAPGICRAHIVGTPGPGDEFGHEILIAPIVPGSCTVTVADAHGRTVALPVTVHQHGQRQP